MWGNILSHIGVHHTWHHFHLTVTMKCQNLTQLWQCNGVRVHLFVMIS